MHYTCELPEPKLMQIETIRFEKNWVTSIREHMRAYSVKFEERDEPTIFINQSYVDSAMIGDLRNSIDFI